MAIGGVHRITPSGPGFVERLEELIAARSLFGVLLAREIRVRYKQTALGLAWVVLQPLLPAAIFAAVFGLFAGLPSDGIPYFLFALSGLVAYGFFSAVVSRSSTSLLRDAQLLTKVYFPRSISPIASGTTATVDFGIGVLLVLGLALSDGRGLRPELLALPIIAALTLVLGLGIGLGVAAASAHYRDFAIATPFVLQILLYLSPVAYSTDLVPPTLRGIYSLNPLVALVEAFRWAVIGTPLPSVADFLLSAIVGFAVVGIGALVFARASRDLSDVL